MRFRRKIIVSGISWWRMFDIVHEFEKSCENILLDMEKCLFPDEFDNDENR